MDTAVQSGQNFTYYYVLTAVNFSGAESAQSGPASVTVPWDSQDHPSSRRFRSQSKVRRPQALVPLISVPCTDG